MPDDGVLTLSERFRNIEKMLQGIDEKLDRKVDADTFQILVRRVEMVESGETPLGRLYLRQIDNMNTQMNDLINHGSRNAQESAKELETLRSEVQLLQSQSVGARAIIKNDQDTLNRRYQRAALLVALVSTVALIVSIVNLVSLLSH